MIQIDLVYKSAMNILEWYIERVYTSCLGSFENCRSGPKLTES